jgi:hypothetical protein
MKPARKPDHFRNASPQFVFLFAILATLEAVFYLTFASPSFWNQLRTFGWERVQATIVTNNIQLRATSGWGCVDFKYYINGKDVVGHNWVSHRWTFNLEKKFEVYRHNFSPGQTITILISPTGQTSLGHFPEDYVMWYGISGLFWSIIATPAWLWFFILRRNSKLKEPTR